MKRLLLILILILNFHSLSKADDIRELQIEGITIGDSIFKHIKRDDFDALQKYTYFYPDKKFAVTVCKINSEITTEYDQISCTYKVTSNDYKVYGISGGIKYDNNISSCLIKKNEIVKEFSEILTNTIKVDRGTYDHDADSTGNSFQTVVDFMFDVNSYVRVVCHDWSNKITLEKKWYDELKVYITSKELNYYINR